VKSAECNTGISKLFECQYIFMGQYRDCAIQKCLAHITIQLSDATKMRSPEITPA